MSKEFKVQVPTDFVRNPDVPCNVFVLYAKLIQLYYATYQKEEFEADHKMLMYYLNIGDNRTLKKSYNMLFEMGYVKNKVETLPRKKPITVKMNIEKIPNKDNGIMFTQLPTSILDLVVLKAIGEIGLRIMYYIQSRINKTQGIYSSSNFCYASEETIAKEIGVDRKTVIEYLKVLHKIKFLKIDKHKLEETGEYLRKGETDIIQFIKYNNHYFVREDKINEFRLKKHKELLEAR
ncbi:hypothetical protein [Schinkia azotoformans]|uniref:hypothetical protein n=1 Tax=Schinkia azotoformans TaxID=1454 RepID=UPI002DBF4A41|nr:hypothetical protein [Schinkia azotoformans]MEC1697737.1 helix-turn-helix domain-containing protein [Schinkia azotoformans]